MNLISWNFESSGELGLTSDHGIHVKHAYMRDIPLYIPA